LVSEFRDIHLILIGSGQGFTVSCQEALVDFVKNNNLESTVTFTGNVENVHKYLQAGDFFVFPSQSEALGISLLEAMSCELPCIASNVGGIPDIIEHNVNGVLVPYGDERKLLEAMRELLSNHERATQLGSEARKTVVEKYNIDRIVDQYLSLS
jgi:glycosyltransferase involved in cell wall biosynthesis